MVKYNKNPEKVPQYPFGKVGKLVKEIEKRKGFM